MGASRTVEPPLKKLPIFIFGDTILVIVDPVDVPSVISFDSIFVVVKGASAPKVIEVMGVVSVPMLIAVVVDPPIVIVGDVTVKFPVLTFKPLFALMTLEKVFANAQVFAVASCP